VLPLVDMTIVAPPATLLLPPTFSTVPFFATDVPGGCRFAAPAAVVALNHRLDAARDPDVPRERFVRRLVAEALDARRLRRLHPPVHRPEVAEGHADDAGHAGAAPRATPAPHGDDRWRPGVRPHAGVPFAAQSVSNRAKAAWRTAGLTPIALHEARHTFASFAIAAGVDVKALSTYCGHASVTITIDRYGHLFPGNEAEAAGLLDEYLERATG
jgi:integrase